MIEIIITDEHKLFIAKEAPKLDLGGFSNLSSNDLKKASRLDFQYTGLFGELAWNIFRHNSINKMKDLLEFKEKTLNKKGDQGFDDFLTYKNQTRFVDIKTSHTDSISKISSLNLIIPEREFHHNMIYVAAFSIGQSRRNVNKVILAGWAFSEDIKEKWFFDSSKFCVKVNDLRPISKLKNYFG